MSSSWYLDPFEIDVENPGHGQLRVTRVGSHTDAGWTIVLSGPQLGAGLRALTDLSLDTERHDAPVFGRHRLTHDEARDLLPAFQLATILAVGGTDRSDRVRPPDDDEPPLEPRCIHCGAGSAYSPGEEARSSYCDEHGHQPFGQYAGWSWQTATRAYERDNSWWVLMRSFRSPQARTLPLHGSR